MLLYIFVSIDTLVNRNYQYFPYRQKSAGNSGQQSLQKRMLREALEEDASVFQYDEVYDSMQAAKTSRQEVKDPVDKKVRNKS